MFASEASEASARCMFILGNAAQVSAKHAAWPQSHSYD